MFEKALALVLALSMVVSGGGAAQIRERAEKWLSVPVIDGAKETAELTAAFVSGYTGIDYNAVFGDTVHSGTDAAFERLISGEVDIVIDTYLQPHMTDGFIENYFEYSFETVATRTVDVIDPPYEYTDHEYYRVFYDKNRINQNVIDFIEFTLSDKGQASVYQSDFEPIRDIALPYFEKPPYETLGTGEPRPDDFEKSKEFSALSFAYSNYGASEEYAHNIDIFLLDNDLTNTKLEKEINIWIEETIKNKNLTDKYRDCIVYFQAINGYLEVVISRTPGEGGYYLPDSPVSVWNLKTGERVTEFSDLFYEGTDFLPALKETYKTVFPDKHGVSLTTEPDRFFITDFLLGDMDYRYIDDEYGGETVEDEYKLPINFLSPVMDYSPVWTYYDLTPHFTEKHLDPTEWRSVRDIALPKLSTKAVMFNDNFREWEIISSRFLSDEEIEIRNSELKKLYNYIENSDEFISYNKSYDDEYFLIDTYVSFSDDGRQALVKTPFGSYYTQMGSAKIKTSDDDIRLSQDENFLGLVDIDFDGTPEWISVSNSINVYDENFKILNKIPLFGAGKYFELQKWQVEKDTESGGISGIIYYSSGGEYSALCYEIEGGGLEITRNRQYQLSTEREKIEKTDISLENTQSVTYTGAALSTPTVEMISGMTVNAFESLYKNQKNYGEKPYSAVIFENSNTAFFTENSAVYNETKILEKVYSGSILSVMADEAYQIVAVKPADKTLPALIWEYSNGILNESPISQKALSFSYTQSGRYNFSAQFAINDKYDIVNNKKTAEQDSNSAATETKKEYWFYILNGKLTEYGGKEIPKERFVKLPQGRDAISEIELGSGTVTSIIYRYNGIVNINYDVKSLVNPDKTNHFYKTYYYDYHNTYIPPELTFIEKGEGVYLLSITEEIGISGMNKPSYDMFMPY
jgi:hypothetical protein